MKKLAGLFRLAHVLYPSLWAALDWVFPPTCGGCNTTGTRWCSTCQSQVMLVSAPFCEICGDLQNDLPAGETPAGTVFICDHCQSQRPAYQSLRSYGVFKGPLREAIHRMKYQKDLGMGEALSKHLIELYNHLKWDIDLIAPVPLSRKRELERGYNQAGLLGRSLAYAVQKTYQPEIILRSRDTRSQVGLSAQERRQNVAGAFSADTQQVRGKTVLIIDDVTTTGSTIHACAQALHNAGASAVYGLTLARAVSQADADDRPTTSS